MWPAWAPAPADAGRPSQMGPHAEHPKGLPSHLLRSVSGVKATLFSLCPGPRKGLNRLSISRKLWKRRKLYLGLLCRLRPVVGTPCCSFTAETTTAQCRPRSAPGRGDSSARGRRPVVSAQLSSPHLLNQHPKQHKKASLPRGIRGCQTALLLLRPRGRKREKS